MTIPTIETTDDYPERRANYLATVATLKKDTATHVLVTWHDFTREVFPYALQTLDYLVAHADGCESIEFVELVTL